LILSKADKSLVTTFAAQLFFFLSCGTVCILHSYLPYQLQPRLLSSLA
jgi:hypothetical protein